MRRTNCRLGIICMMANPELGAIYRQIRALESQLDSSEQASRYAELLNTYQERDGFRLQAEAEKSWRDLDSAPGEETCQWACCPVVNALGPSRQAIALPDRPLLIDEPSNHLDIAAREWLEEYLSRLNAAYLAVSHDRFFLNEATSRILEICH